MKHIFFAMPCKSGTFEWATVSSLMQSVAACRDMGWKIHFEAALYDSLIPNARNLLAAKFLASPCTDLFWVDDDNGWTKGGFVRLMQHDLDFVAMPYRRKDDVVSYTYKIDGEIDDKGLACVKYIGLGIARMRRSVIKRMYEADSRRYVIKGPPADMSVAPLFEVAYEDGVMSGEDVVFCKRWRAAGGEIWVDLAQQTSHIGKKNYSV